MTEPALLVLYDDQGKLDELQGTRAGGMGGSTWSVAKARRLRPWIAFAPIGCGWPPGRGRVCSAAMTDTAGGEFLAVAHRLQARPE